jgi:Zn finger protein HypA/HybF involved in hydrogenase expression
MKKLTNSGDRVRAVIECAACGSDSQTSGATFAEAEAKLTEANGFTYEDMTVTHCPRCESIRAQNKAEDEDE